MHVPGQRGRAAIAADLGGGDRVGLVVRAEAAVLFRDRDAEQAALVQIAVILGREFGVAIVGRGAAGEHALPEFARGRDDRGLLVVQTKRCGIEHRRIERLAVEAILPVGAVMMSGPEISWLSIRKSHSTALNSSGRSRLARWPTPSSST